MIAVNRAMAGLYVRDARGQAHKITHEIWPASGRFLAIPVNDNGEPVGGRGARGLLGADCREVSFELGHYARTGELRLMP